MSLWGQPRCKVRRGCLCPATRHKGHHHEFANGRTGVCYQGAASCEQRDNVVYWKTKRKIKDDRTYCHNTPRTRANRPSLALNSGVVSVVIMTAVKRGSITAGTRLPQAEPHNAQQWVPNVSSFQWMMTLSLGHNASECEFVYFGVLLCFIDPRVRNMISPKKQMIVKNLLNHSKKNSRARLALLNVWSYWYLFTPTVDLALPLSISRVLSLCFRFSI